MTGGLTGGGATGKETKSGGSSGRSSAAGGLLPPASVGASSGGGGISGLPETSKSGVSGASSGSGGVSGLPSRSHGSHSHAPSRSHTPGPNTDGHASTNGGGGATGASLHATPQTGASKMAAAAKRGLDGVGAGVAAGALSRAVGEVEGHPLSDKALKARDYQTLSTLNHLFHLPTRWRLIRPLGQGAYGLVINVQDTLSGEPVAVKCITRVFDKVILARRALREITLLRHFGEHENLTGLIDLDHVWEGYNEIYLYMEPMDADLHQIVRSGQPLTNAHIQFFLYQLLRGMKYIHSANVIHRDLKPGNLLVNSDCELKICDFGLARGFRPAQGEEEGGKLTEYVATRWYRAPEVMLSNRRYTTAIDVWSIGCILAELLGGGPLFKGKDYVDQLNLILEVLGTPDDETLAKVGSEKACSYIKTLPHYEGKDLGSMFPDADPQAVDLLKQLLTFDPAQRIDVSTALLHPYMSTYHDPTDEPSCPEVFEKWEQVESLNTIEELREAISREIAEFRDEVRGVGVDVEDIEMEEDGAVEWPEGEAIDGQGHGAVFYDTPAVEPAPTFADQSPTQRLQRTPGPAPHSILPGTTSPSPSKAVPFPVPASAISSTSGAGSAPRTRDHSPSTPHTALTEDSFGAPYGGNAPGTFSGRSSRRQSAHSITGRRPASFLFSPFGAGMTPMTQAVPTMSSSVPTSTAPASANPADAAGGTGTVPPPAPAPAEERERERRPSGHWGRRSRQPSQSGMGLMLGRLSQLEMKGKVSDGPGGADGTEDKAVGVGLGVLGVGGDGEVPPMTVSPSDAPPSEAPKSFGA